MQTGRKVAPTFVVSLEPILSGKFSPKKLILNSKDKDKDKIIIGRPSGPNEEPLENNGIFTEKVLSRQHAQIYLKNDLIFIKDLKSSNGTFLNGIKLKTNNEEYELKTGDVLVFGIDILGEDGKIANHGVPCKVKVEYPSNQSSNNSSSSSRLAMELVDSTVDLINQIEISDDFKVKELETKIIELESKLMSQNLSMEALKQDSHKQISLLLNQNSLMENQLNQKTEFDPKLFRLIKAKNVLIESSPIEIQTSLKNLLAEDPNLPLQVQKDFQDLNSNWSIYDNFTLRHKIEQVFNQVQGHASTLLNETKIFEDKIASLTLKLNSLEKENSNLKLNSKETEYQDLLEQFQVQSDELERLNYWKNQFETFAGIFILLISLIIGLYIRYYRK